jgi:hypothetical protein
MVDLAPDQHYTKAVQPGTTVADGGFNGARWFRIAGVLISVLGAAVLIAASYRLSGGAEALLKASPFVVWGLVPFALGVFGLRGKAAGVPRSLGVVLASGFGLAMYSDLLWSTHLSSTAGLAFLFIPLWQSLGCAAALVFTRRWRRSGGAA